MGVAIALRKTSWARVNPGEYLSSPWRRSQRRARVRRLFWVVGLVAGIGVVAALLWLKRVGDAD